MGEYFSLSSNIKSRTPYASTIINFKDLIFICKTCGSMHFYENINEIILLVEGKGKFPDKMLCGHLPLTIVSDNVLNAWKENNITGYLYNNVKLVSKNGMDINNELKYYNITVTGKTELDIEKMGISIKSRCNDCGQVKFGNEIFDVSNAIMKDNSYNSTDLFVFNFFKNSPLCNKRTIEIIYKYKLTNFFIKKIEKVFDLTDPGIDIKTLFK